ncbi:MAG: anthranilate synthase component I family protein [Planctomycetaceae bacterium]|jgi:anthranilate synthase component 1|nr:anthranilate synthase component I family protein [Planctomycetaceae bacterium]
MTTQLNHFLEECQKADVVPVTRQLLADLHTPVSLLQRFYNGQEGVFLLESVEGGEKWGRYSFLGIAPHAFIEVHRNDISVIVYDESGKIVAENKTPHHGKPLQMLRQLMSHYRAAEHADLPRFFGGLVGYFAYEMVEFFENIPNQLENEPFASFVIPRTMLIFDNARQTLTICVLTFPNQIHSQQPPDINIGTENNTDTENNTGAENNINTKNINTDSRLRKLYADAVTETERIAAELEKPIPMLQPKHTGKLKLRPVLPEEEYYQRVETIKEHIAAGDLIQCVFSQQFVSEHAPDAVSLYRALRFANPAPYLFFMHLSGSVLAGSSPETMIRLEGKTATLRPIAGTRKRGETEQRDRELADEMLRDPKEKAEHLMLVDLGRNDLGRIAKTGTVQVTDLMFIERHPHVMHLVTNVTAQLEDGYDGFDLFEATFPAGTLSGAPKVRAMQIIAEQEETPRGPYGGAAGYISFGGNIDFAITIRTAKIRNGKLTAQAGGGIVYDSVPELERKETVNKAMGIARAVEMLTPN